MLPNVLVDSWKNNCAQVMVMETVVIAFIALIDQPKISILWENYHLQIQTKTYAPIFILN